VAKDFTYLTCPAGKRLYRNGRNCNKQGRRAIQFSSAQRDCEKCPLRAQCLRHPQRSKRRQVAIFVGKHVSAREKASDRMKRRIDSEHGREMIGRRFATVEPVFGNLRANKKMNRFTLRGGEQSRRAVEALLHGTEHREVGTCFVTISGLHVEAE
jgi:hypothetical protein